MKITLLSHNNDSIKIVFENAESLLIPIKLEIIKNLSKGKVLTLPEYNVLKGESDLYRCQKKAVSYIARCNKSVNEVKRYLRKKEFETPIIEEVVSYLLEKKYLDDEKFAKSFIDYKKRTKIVGANYLKNELLKKGLDKNIIDKALVECNVEDDIDDLYSLALKKYEKIKAKKNSLSKLIYFLKSRGFNNSSIYRVIEKLKDEGYSFYNYDIINEED